MNISKAVDNRLRELGMRKADLAERLYCRRNTISDYHRSNYNVKLRRLEQICRALDIPLSELIKRAEREEPGRR